MLQQQERGQSPGSTGCCSYVTFVGQPLAAPQLMTNGPEPLATGEFTPIFLSRIGGGVRITRGPAVLATAAALALINLGLASLVALAVGARGFVPVWLAVALLVSGVVAAAVAATLWRGYLNSVRAR
jgi:hypothetical protein